MEKISFHLPQGICLIVKEHPKTFSYRSAAWIKKVNSIPNVYYSPPEASTNDLIDCSKSVITISGFVGLEAVVIRKKPVITLGDTPINMLPNEMVMNINTGDLTTAFFENNIASYQYNDSTLLNFIAANIQIGKKLNI